MDLRTRQGCGVPVVDEQMITDIPATDGAPAALENKFGKHSTENKKSLVLVISYNLSQRISRVTRQTR